MPVQSKDFIIPQEKIAAVNRGLEKAFGVAACDDIHDLTERPGSNRAFRIVVRGTRYLLRINTRPGDMARHFHCMQAAAEAGLAPRVLYADAEDRISITEFVNAVPFPATTALHLVPATLRRLHALPAFPIAPFNTTCTFLLNKGPALDGFLLKFRSSKMLPADEIEAVLAHYVRLAEAYSNLEPDTVPSHNDLFKPDNILFDGSRVWFVDWEASFQNDRYADLAVLANMLVASEDDERTFLQEYFGAAPTEHQAARLHLMRQLAHMFYAMAFLGLDSADKPVSGYGEYQRRFWAREVDLADNEKKALYGRVHWQQLMHNLNQPRYKQSLRTVAADRSTVHSFLSGLCELIWFA